MERITTIEERKKNKMTFKELKKIIADRIEKSDEDLEHANCDFNGSKYWKGREIIQLDKWLKITKANTISSIKDYNVRQGLQYFPDDYVKWMFPLGIPQQELQEEANKWYSEYLELMAFKRNPVYGKMKCYGCLLSTHREEAAIYIGINKVIAKGLEGQENNNNSNNTSTSQQQPLYPCKIQNRFECPYEKKGKKTTDAKFDVEDLFALDRMAFQVELAFGKAQEKETSNIQIKTVQDIYHALTNTDTLNKILEQGLKEEEHMKYKDHIVEFFMSFKDKITIEDLRL
jgi:hypothetical protein